MNYHANNNLLKLIGIGAAFTICTPLLLKLSIFVGNYIGSATTKDGWDSSSKSTHIQHSELLCKEVCYLLAYTTLICAFLKKEPWLAFTPAFALSNYIFKCGFAAPVTNINTQLAKYEKGLHHLRVGATCGMITGRALTEASNLLM